MIKKLWILVALLFACGGVEGEQDYIELGTDAQTYLTLNTPTYQFGTRKNAALSSCGKTDAAQVCTIPKFKKIEVARVPASWTANELSRIAGVRQSIGIVFPSWQTALVDAATTPAADAVRITLNKGTVSGALSGLIDGYRSVTFAGSVALTEGTGGALPVGSYERHSSCTAVIDTTDIYNKGSSTSQDNNLLDQAVGNSVLVCMGVGTREDLPNVWSMRDAATFALGVATNGEVCKADFSDLADQADFSTSTFSACPTN